MNRIVFLFEEYSMKMLLDRMLPRLVPDVSFLCVPHEGKQDLDKSIPRKLIAWKEPGVCFVIVRDNDGADCKELKAKLMQLAKTSGRQDVLVRIACQELEAWYLGQPQALTQAYARPALQNLSRKKNYRYPDKVQQPSLHLTRLIPEFQKVSGARLMGELLTFEGNSSHSFKAFNTGVRQIAERLKAST